MGRQWRRGDVPLRDQRWQHQDSRREDPVRREFADRADDGDGECLILQWTSTRRVKSSIIVQKCRLGDGFGPYSCPSPAGDKGAHVANLSDSVLPQKLRGQQHILQRLQAADLDVPFSPPTVLRVLHDQRLTLFEFARYGSLQSVLQKNGDPNAAASAQSPLPNRALVEIFRCREFHEFVSCQSGPS